MTVHFIGAGPGAADLITLRGARLLAACPVCLYAGSIVPLELLEHCPSGAQLVDTAPLDLDAIERHFIAAHEAGQDVARLQSGDLSLYSAVAEQLRRCARHGIPVSLTPGVPAFAAAAAVLQRELTVPGVVQTVVLTRVPGRASAMPDREQLATYAATGATLAIHLAAALIDRAMPDLLYYYGPDCPCALVVRTTWPDERIIRATLGTLDASGVERTALLLVGPALDPAAPGESALYSPDYSRRYRP
jgi:precorrin-4/cobalt-precorrin-4 C11-methyltransferase